MVEILIESKEIIIAGIFTIIGAVIGFVGTVIQSKISAKTNMELIKRQSEQEIQQHRYYEKEKLYSDIIDFLAAIQLAINYETRKIKLSRDDKIKLNTFNPRLNIYSSKNLMDGFYDLVEYICSESDDEKRVNEVRKYEQLLLDDLMIRDKNKG